MGLVGGGAQATVSVGLVVLVVALEPDHLAVALEREHVRRDAVQEPPIVADDDHAARERQQRVLEGAQQQRKVGTLSGGERNRVHLAKLLQRGSNLLLLDEPTNDLDVDTLRALEEALLAFAGCAVVISHDRWFLDRIATHILAWEGDEEDGGRWFWFEGNFASYEENKVERLGIEAARPHRVTHRRLTRD